MCQTPSKRQTNKRTNGNIRLSVVFARRDASQRLRGTFKYMKFGQYIIRKITTIMTIRCHILRLKCTKFDSRCLSVCPFVS